MVDFYCPELKLAIEVDGDSHLRDGAPEYDAERQLFLEAKGITVVRITNEQVYKDLDVAISLIKDAIIRMSVDGGGGADTLYGLTPTLPLSIMYKQVRNSL